MSRMLADGYYLTEVDFNLVSNFSFQKGDVVECHIEQIGSIINKVV